MKTRGSRMAARAAMPWPSQVPTAVKDSRATGSPATAPMVTMGPVMASGWPLAISRSRVAEVGDWAARWRASWTRARPLAYCSQQPALPQPQGRPSGTRVTWPTSAAAPKAPRTSSPPRTTPPPRPVPTVRVTVWGWPWPPRSGSRPRRRRWRRSRPPPGGRCAAPPRPAGARCARPGWGEQHGGAGGVHEPGRAQAGHLDLVVGRQLGDGLGDDVLDLGRVVGRGVAAQPGQDAAVVVDHAGGDLGPADVHADGQPHGPRPPGLSGY
jgi:hypothetical protein